MTAYRLPAIAVATVLVVVSAILFPFLGSEFIPRLDEGSLAVQVQQLPSVSLTQSVKTTTEVEKVLKRFPGGNEGCFQDGTGGSRHRSDEHRLQRSLHRVKAAFRMDDDALEGELVEKMSKALEEGVPNASFSFSQPIELRVAELISGVRSDVAIKLFGDDLDTLKKSATRSLAWLCRCAVRKT